jgi:DNA invertase Pin-like site-specific DNA recombinase
MPTAHVYIRFSHIDQREGTSTARQRKACIEHVQGQGWELGSVLIDEGRSAFSGKNRDVGSTLRRFEDEAEAGEHFGAILVVERLDRLSRQGHRATHAFICKLNDLGVSVATVDGSAFYRAGEELDLIQVMTLLIKAETAREESEKKAGRLRDAHAIRRAEVAEHGGVLRAVCPAWLDKKNGHYVERPERVALIREIFRLADEGQGSVTIAKMLNKRGEPLWVRPRGKVQRAWDVGRIQKFLADPAVLGEYHGRRWENGRRVPTGVIIKLFPRIVDADLFVRVRASAELRAQTKGGGRSAVVSNLVSGLAKCRHCGGSMEYIRHRRVGATYKGRNGVERIMKHESAALYCRAAYRHARSCSNRIGITYYGFERALLDEVLHIAMDDRAFARNDEAAKLTRELAEKEREADQARAAAEALWTEWASDGQKSAMKKRLAEQAESRSVALDEQVEVIRKARAKAAGQASSEEHLSRIAEVRAHLYADDLEVRAKHRRKVMEALRSVITSMDCDDQRTVTIGFANGLTAVQIKGGKVIARGDGRPGILNGDFSPLGDERIQRIALTVTERMGGEVEPPSRENIKKMLERRVWTAG